MTGIRYHEELRPYLVPIDKIEQHPRNPNNGDVDAIAELILANGFYGVITAQKSTGYILAGNHRYAALLSLGATEVPVAFVDVDDERALRILIGDNRSAEMAVRNGEELEQLLRELEQFDEGLTGTGYTDDAFDELVRMNNIAEHAGFEQKFNQAANDSEHTPMVVIRGFMEDGHVRLFDHGDAEEALLRLRDLGYHAIGTMGDE